MSVTATRAPRLKPKRVFELRAVLQGKNRDSSRRPAAPARDNLAATKRRCLDYPGSGTASAKNWLA
jgi:hypothetical protein